VPVAGLAGRVESRRLQTSIGYRVVYAPEVRMVQVVDGGLVATDAEAIPPLFAALRSALGEADAVALPPLELGSELLAAADALGGPLERQRLIAPWTRRRLALPGSFEEFLATRSRNVRSGIRYDTRKLLAALGDELSVEILRGPGDLDRFVADLDRVARSSYQRAVGAGFADTPEQRALAEIGLEHGWVRAYVLYRGSEPIAYWLCSTYRGRLVLRTTGFLGEYASHRVGIYLLMRVIEDACADPSLDVLDFGPGDAAYKRQFSSDSRVERNVVVFAPTFRGRRINATRSAVLGLASLAHRALDATRLTDAVKSRWRGRLRA